jgi:hypothetical protein
MTTSSIVLVLIFAFGIVAESVFIVSCIFRLSVSWEKQKEDKRVTENSIRFMKLKLLDKSNNYF